MSLTKCTQSVSIVCLSHKFAILKKKRPVHLCNEALGLKDLGNCKTHNSLLIATEEVVHGLQHWHYLSFLELQNLLYTPDWLNQNLRSNNVPRWLECMLYLEDTAKSHLHLCSRFSELSHVVLEYNLVPRTDSRALEQNVCRLPFTHC